MSVRGFSLFENSLWVYSPLQWVLSPRLDSREWSWYKQYQGTKHFIAGGFFFCYCLGIVCLLRSYTTQAGPKLILWMRMMLNSGIRAEHQNAGFYMMGIETQALKAYPHTTGFHPHSLDIDTGSKPALSLVSEDGLGLWWDQTGRRLQLTRTRTNLLLPVHLLSYLCDFKASFTWDQNLPSTLERVYDCRHKADLQDCGKAFWVPIVNPEAVAVTSWPHVSASFPFHCFFFFPEHILTNH